ncbi:MAG: hypothetical protein COA88_13150 [Kordia sp.]|nr:MAG: hypothetical protein COA88_13150 [Kordia sp.]
MIGIGNAIGYAVQIAFLISLFTIIILPSFFVYVLNKQLKLGKLTSIMRKPLLIASYLLFALTSQFIAIKLLLVNKMYVIGWLVLLSLGIYLLNWLITKNNGQN